MRQLLYFIILSSLTFSLCEAAVISPELQAILQTISLGQEIPVIINLADKADVNQIISPANNTREGKAHKRNAVAKALRDKADKTQGPLKTLLQGRAGKKMKSLWITNSVAVTVPASVISELVSRSEIASIELDAVIQAPLIEPSTTGTPRWNIDRVNAPVLWGAGIDGGGAVVANLDTGVDVNHPDLKYRWRGGACSAPPDCPSWFDPYNNTTLPYGIPATGGSFTELDAIHAHGTHTMGIMVGGSASFNDNAIGVAPGAKWISAKISDDATGESTISVFLSGLQWVLQPAGDSANAPDVVNNSWVLDRTAQNICDTAVLTAISNLTTAGIEVVFAAGNVNPGPAPASSSFSPANNAGVFAVGATDCVGSGCSDPTNVIAPYSALGPSACPDRTTSFPNVVAPGSNIFSSAPTGGRFGSYQVNNFGTSFAAPHVAGAAALLVGAMPALTPAQIEEALQNTALPLGGSVPNNTYGWGLLDAEAAYKYAFIQFGKGNVPQIAGPSTLSFIDVATSGSDEAAFLLVNQGTANLTINSISIAGTNQDDFVITNISCSSTFPFIISSLSSCSITILFSPGATGRRTAQLSVSSNDGVTPILNIPLTGNDPIARVHDSEIVATYPDLQAASNGCSNWDTIRMQAVTLTGDAVFDLPLGITVSLQGGYDTVFESQTGFTTVQGTLTITKGTAIVGNVIVQ